MFPKVPRGKSGGPREMEIEAGDYIMPLELVAGINFISHPHPSFAHTLPLFLPTRLASSRDIRVGGESSNWKNTDETGLSFIALFLTEEDGLI